MESQQGKIRITEYSKLSIAVFNVPKKYEENFRKLGGLYNPKLGEESGWLFHIRDKPKIQQIVDEANSGKLSPIVLEHKQDHITKKEFMNLLQRVEKLEAQMSNLQNPPVKIELNENDDDFSHPPEIKVKDSPPPSSSKGMFRHGSLPAPKP
jgi:hypothetical protein